MSNFLKVIGAQPFRNGTNSLKEALNSLGYNCLHGFTLVENWNNTNHKSFWDKVYDNGPNNINWDDFYAHNKYDAGCDGPTFYFWKSLSKYYPKSKIIHCTRNNEDWYKSLQSIIDTVATERHNFGGVNFHAKLFEKYGPRIELKHTNDIKYKETCIRFYENWNEDIIEYFHKNKIQNRLMIIDLDKMDRMQTMKDLCEFLEFDYNQSKLKEYPLTNTNKDKSKDFDNTMNDILSNRPNK